MITKLLVVQKIEDNGKLNDVYQISSEFLGWTFEDGRTKINSDKPFFPFTIKGNSTIFKSQPGAETKSFINNNKLTFYDDYSVPAGCVVGILFPKNYVPDIIKFKDSPFIPTNIGGQMSTKPPGQVQVLYNHLEKQCAIAFHIHDNTLFGFKCIAKFVSDENYPRNQNVLTENLFDIELSSELLGVESIQTSDLKLINETLNQADLVNIQNILNDILVSVKAGDEKSSKSLINKLGTYVLNGSATASSLTTLADSYNAGNSAHQFIGRILESLSLM